MELAIIRRETSGAGSEKFNENETITKFEIMDGAPVKGMYLFTLQLTFAVFSCMFSNLSNDQNRRINPSSFVSKWISANSNVQKY